MVTPTAVADLQPGQTISHDAGGFPQGDWQTVAEIIPLPPSSPSALRIRFEDGEVVIFNDLAQEMWDRG